jgi:S-adenosylmethionine synthetase
MNNHYILASESVSRGHPDKTCDAISDALLDFVFSKDKFARCAFESFTIKDNVIIGGETKINGYSLTVDDVKITNFIHRKPSDISQGVDEAQGKEEGAGEQEIMFGYACREMEELMPSSIYYAHKILQNMAKNIVAKGYAERCTVQLSYVIGISKPISIYVNTHGTGKVPKNEIIKMIEQKVDLSTKGIRIHLRLNNPIYLPTASFDHFDRKGFRWEEVNLF